MIITTPPESPTYILDKYRFLKKISYKIEEIKIDQLSDRYLKPIIQSGPPLPEKK